MRQPPRALLIDLDGVLRHWDPAFELKAEQDHGLTPGVLLATAMSWELYRPAVSGETTDEQWMAAVADRLPLPVDEARAAVAEWQEHRGYLDSDVLAFVRQVRKADIPVGLATNATDRLAADLEKLGLDDEFDKILNSSAMRVHKPAPEFFQQAALALEVDPKLILFVDDDDRAVTAARAVGLAAFRWTGVEGVTYLAKALGI